MIRIDVDFEQPLRMLVNLEDCASILSDAH